MSDERPDALLKSALEKIVYFEARAGSLNGDYAAARTEVERLKADLASASQREIELRRELAEREVRLQRAHAENQDVARINEALRRERAGLIGRMLEASRIHDAGSPAELDSPFDLASFIAQLRNEVHDRADQPKQVGEASHARKTTASSPLEHAERLHAEGRLSVTVREVMELSGSQPFAGRTEETMFGFSIRELSAPDAAARVRAAERLKAVGHAASAAPLATALNAETEPTVLVALLDAFAAVAKEEGAGIVQPLLASATPEVRVAALKTLMKLSPQQAAPHLSAAMKDPDRAVRRRASLLALGLDGEAALSLGEEAIRDTDADVRSVGALVLGSSSGERARGLLMRALRDADMKVRKSAAQSLSRMVGEDVSPLVELDDAQRRRELRRVATLPSNPVMANIDAALEYATVSARGSTAAARVGSPGMPATHATPHQHTAPPARATSPQAAPSFASQPSMNPASAAAPQSVAQVAAPPAAPLISESLCAQLVSDVRCAIRGRTLQDLAGLSGVDEVVAANACELLVARGSILKRGVKYFAA